jgi:predicted RNA-binding Zn-ribbon protein involved in translation (DUF1610 family)
MTLSLSHFFFFYPTLFLAVIAVAWFVWGWKRRRSELTGRRFFVCGFCQQSIPAERSILKVRCPSCGAQQECKKLKVQE